MKIKFPTGSTAENNQLLLPEGMISIDMEKKALRLHDGVTQGGFEMVGAQAYVPPSPFRGVVPSAELYTGTELAQKCNLPTSSVVNDDAGWLHFVDPVDQKTKYIAMKPINIVTPYQLNLQGLITGTKVVSKNGNNYKVRLLKGLGDDFDPEKRPSLGFDPTPALNTEWNRLMYRISGKPFSDYRTSLASEGIEEGDWAQYSEDDLGMKMYSYCQETWYRSGLTVPKQRMYRGGVGVSYGGSSGEASSNTPSSSFGWRPCLELVE